MPGELATGSDYQLSCSPFERAGVSSCMGADVKLLQRMMVKGERVKKEMVKGRNASMHRELHEHAAPYRRRAKAACQSSCLKASTPNDGKGNAVLKVLRIVSKFMDGTIENGKFT